MIQTKRGLFSFFYMLFSPISLLLVFLLPQPISSFFGHPEKAGILVMAFGAIFCIGLSFAMLWDEVATSKDAS